MNPPPTHRPGPAAGLAGFKLARRVLLTLAALCLVTQPPAAYATQFIHVGKVAKVYSLDRTCFDSPADHFTLEGFAQAGACVINDGLVAVVLSDDEAAGGSWRWC